jgi:hypothetical protein
MRYGRKTTSLTAMLTLTVVVAFLASIAQAELVERGDLFVRFRGGITPNALPRATLAPIAISVAGTVKTLSGDGRRRCARSGSN